MVQGRGNVSFTGSLCVLGEVLEQQAGHPLRVRVQGRLMDVLDDLAAVGEDRRNRRAFVLGFR